MHCLCIGESPSICPFLKNNGDETPKGPSLHYFSGMDRYEDFLQLKHKQVTSTCNSVKVNVTVVIIGQESVFIITVNTPNIPHYTDNTKGKGT